jgi:hypothetical protein
MIQGLTLDDLFWLINRSILACQQLFEWGGKVVKMARGETKAGERRLAIRLAS